MEAVYQELVLGHDIDAESPSFIQPSSGSSSASFFLPESMADSGSADDFWLLPEMPLQPSISAEAELLCDHFDAENASLGKRKIHEVNIREEDTQREREQQGDRLKRTRSAEVHNISERRRRDRIKRKVGALQELLPHCKKKDRASILEEAAEYIKALKFQLEVMMKVRRGECTVPCMSIMPIGPGIGIGIGTGTSLRTEMLGVGCSAQYAPIFHLPSPSLAFSPSGVAGFTFPSVHQQALAMCATTGLSYSGIGGAENRMPPKNAVDTTTSSN